MFRSLLAALAVVIVAPVVAAEDFESVAAMLRRDDRDGLVRFLGRTVRERAAVAAGRCSGHNAGDDDRSSRPFGKAAAP